MKVAVFGKPGGGKSTLALKIATATGLPLHQLDLIQFDEYGAMQRSSNGTLPSWPGKDG